MRVSDRYVSRAVITFANRSRISASLRVGRCVSEKGLDTRQILFESRATEDIVHKCVELFCVVVTLLLRRRPFHTFVVKPIGQIVDRLVRINPTELDFELLPGIVRPAPDPLMPPFSRFVRRALGGIFIVCRGTTLPSFRSDVRGTRRRIRC